MGRFNNESGRSGRTGRRQSYQRKKYSSYESREKEYKFKPHGYGKDKQNISYGKIVEKITTKIQATYERGADITWSIENKKKFDFDTVKPELSDPNDTGEKLIFEKMVEAWVNRKSLFEANWTKTYSYILQNYCTAAMQTALKELPVFETEIKNNPLKLLEHIGVLMHTPMRALYPQLGLIETFARFLNMRQDEKEDILTYMERFKGERQVLKSLIGSKFLEEFTKNTPEYKALGSDSKAQTKLIEDSFEIFSTAVFLRGANQRKYGSLLEGYRGQYAGGRNHYPTTLLTAVDALRTHKTDDKKKLKDVQKKNDKYTSKDEGTGENSFAQNASERRCYACGDKEHMLDTCPVRDDIPRSKWFDRTNREYNLHQDTRNTSIDNRTENDDVENFTRPCWSGVQLCMNTTEGATINDRSVILDSGSTISLFKSKHLVTDIRDTKDKIQLETNGGTRIVDKEGQIKDFGKVYFNEDGIVNIFAVKDLIKRHRVTYDSNNEDAFIVHIGNQPIKFRANQQGLYVFNFPNSYMNYVDNKNTKEVCLQTNATSVEGYTKRQVERADRARKLYHMLGAPTMTNMKAVIRQNLIRNCPVTTEDVNLAEEIFGPDISTLKGRSTRPSPTTVVDDLIEIPEELKKKNRFVDLAIDIILINRVILFTSIDRSVKYRTVVPLDSHKKEELYRGLDQVVRIYNNAGFTIRRIHCDNEFKSIMDPVADEMDIIMNYANPDMHVPDIERNNRVIKERFRIAYYRMPFKKIPKIMIRYLAMVCAKQMNIFPAKNGISKYYSPHMIMSGETYDYKKHCMCEFGTYVQGNTRSSNTNSPRSVDAIYLRPVSSLQGGHEVMNLATGKRVVCSRIVVCKMNEGVVNIVETMAENEGISSLKFSNRKNENVLLLDNDLITGVSENEEGDYDNNSKSTISEVCSDSDEEWNEDELQETISDMKCDHVVMSENENKNSEREEGDDILVDEAPIENEDKNSEQQEDDEVLVEEAPIEPSPRTTRSGRSYAQVVERGVEYSRESGLFLARVINESRDSTIGVEGSFSQQFSLRRGLKKFGTKGKIAAQDEIKQLYTRECFEPIMVKDLTSSEKKKHRNLSCF